MPLRPRALGADVAVKKNSPEAHRDKVHGGAGENNVKDW
jgi:hypothetical protein